MGWVIFHLRGNQVRIVELGHPFISPKNWLVSAHMVLIHIMLLVFFYSYLDYIMYYKWQKYLSPSLSLALTWMRGILLMRLHYLTSPSYVKDILDILTILYSLRYNLWYINNIFLFVIVRGKHNYHLKDRINFKVASKWTVLKSYKWI